MRHHLFVRPATILTVASLALAGCSSGPPPALEVHRLADEIAAAMGRQRPMEQVAGVRRAALPGPIAEALTTAPTLRTAAGAADAAEVSFVCPARFAGRPAILAVLDPSAFLAGRPVTLRIRCPTSTETPVHAS